MKNDNTGRTDEDDILCVRAVRSGDTASFRSIVERYSPVVFGLALRITGSRVEAEDLTQEAMLHVFRKLPSFDLSRRFFPWFYTLIYRHVRKKAFRKQVLTVPLEDIAAENDANDRTEIMQVIMRIIDGLPEKYRTIFMLRYIEQRSYQEIAASLTVPIGTVEGWLFRARKQFIAQVRERNIGDALRLYLDGAKNNAR